MLYEDMDVLKRLRGMIYHLCDEPWMREDCLAVVRAHLWRLENDKPGQKQTYYLEGCHYVLTHFLEQGRSIDSWKRRYGRLPLPNEDPDEQNLPEPFVDDSDSVRSTVCAHEIVKELCGWLKPSEKLVLLDMQKGLTVQESADARGLTQQTVSRDRQRIEILGLRLHLVREA